MSISLVDVFKACGAVLLVYAPYPYDHAIRFSAFIGQGVFQASHNSIKEIHSYRPPYWQGGVSYISGSLAGVSGAISDLNMEISTRQ